MNKREAEIKRTTKETDIYVNIAVDGTGYNKINSGIPFMDHMLILFSKHGLFDIELSAEGDIYVDYHHTVEDIGITLGSAFDKALAGREGIRRYGFASVPMDESRIEVAIDIGGRPFVIYDVQHLDRCIKDIPVQLFEEFFRGFSNSSKMNIHIKYISGVNPHHIVESMFKSFARALDHASGIDQRTLGTIPSTKGVL